MPSTTYEFTARGRLGTKRPQLISGWALAGFAVLVMIPLLMIFPKQTLLREASQQRLGDELTVNYLTNLLRAAPDNFELRLMLAENRIYLGETTGVIELIQPALDSRDPEWQAKGGLMEYKFLLSQLQSVPRNSARYAELERQRNSLFIKLSTMSWPLPNLVFLAGQADQLHERGSAILLYRAIDEEAETLPMQWLVDAAARALAEGEYELAAHLYFLARHREHELFEQRKYLLAGVHALMSGGMYGKAMQEMDKHVGNLADDEETLYALVQAAREANDPQRAVYYAKRLLRMSWMGKIVAWLEQIDWGMLGIASADAAEEDTADFADVPRRPYDARAYQLAYDVFMGSNKLNEAFRVAEAAVRQVPKQREWHKRLAQLAEWLGKPEVALREYKWLLKDNGSHSAMLAVLRLAPILNDYDALLDAWKRQAETSKFNAEQWQNLANLFEQTERQAEGIKFFEARYAADRQPLQLEIAARLAERNGDDALANTLYFRLLKEVGPRAEWVVKVANRYMRLGEYKKAYELLQKYRERIAAKDVDYWKLLADLAWQLQLDNDARKTYLQLKDADKLAREDFGRLIYLLDDSKQEEKADLAESGYRRFGDPDLLMRALEIRAAQHDRLAQRRLFELAAVRRDASLARVSRFYQLRAQYFQAEGEFEAARADYRHAAAIAPDDPNTVNALLWFLIDAHDQVTLREMVEKMSARGDQDRAVYWGALAAAWQVLEQPSRAVAFYSRQLKQGGQDFLWLVNYADALEQAGQTGMADRVRRQAWLQLKARLDARPLKLPFSQDMLAAARLAMLNHPGDQTLALVRSVLRQDRLLQHDVEIDRVTNELVLGWALSGEQTANAKAWLWQRYGQALERPLWADAAVSLAENDKERLDHILVAQADQLSLPVRHDAAKALGHAADAESIAFEELANNPENDEAHARFTEDALAAASYAELGLRAAQIGSLHQVGQSVRVDMPFGQHTRVAAEFRKTRQHDDNASVFAVVPPEETVTGLSLAHHADGGDGSFALRRRNEYARTIETRLAYATALLPRLSLQLAAELHADAPDSIELMEFGMRNRGSIGLGYALDSRNHLHAEQGWARYYTQGGSYLGTGRTVSWEAGHQFSQEYPDWKASLIGAHARFSGADMAPLALPANSNLLGACAAVGESARQPYARAWRPALGYCSTHNDVSGQGYNASFSLAGPLAGADQLSLAFTQERGGVNLLYGLSHEFKLNYRYFFD